MARGSKASLDCKVVRGRGRILNDRVCATSVVFPGSDGKFGTEDDLGSDNELHIPVNKPILVVPVAFIVIFLFGLFPDFVYHLTKP
jgi:hypothetical protein